MSTLQTGDRLGGKIALVTGAAQGIGQACAELFAAQGAEVLLTDINDEAGQRAQETIGSAGVYRHLDVASAQEWVALTDWIASTYGRLDVLVNNAGITGFTETDGPHDPEHFDLASWHRIHAVNLDGVALGCKYAISLMQASPAASIVNISSRSGMVGIPAAAAYASSKAAVRNHTKSVALYCAEQGYPIRCNSLHPGAILTPIWDAMLGQGEARQQALEQLAAGIPLGHMGEPMDVAYAALYLASEESRYVTGVELTIDGGILAGSSAAPSTQED